MNTKIPPIINPYVGPRTFERDQHHLFFGREQEARDLLSRVVSERLLLFYAQSGAGKSSLINTRLIPALQDEGFVILPVGRVSGEMPEDVDECDCIHLLNLMLSLDQGEGKPHLLATLTLSEFLAHLASEDGERWVYDPQVVDIQTADGSDEPGQPFVLIIDQFEEIITSHHDRWKERETFFRQLNQALLDDPNLWVVLTLREDYVAALDPYAPLLFNRLRARYYMERMKVDSALQAIQRPAELGGRPFAPDVAEQLVYDLRQVRIPGQEATIPGQYVEPVQLQVVCFQLWENLIEGAAGTEPGVDSQISFDDLAEAGDVNQALTQFYEETLAIVLSDPLAQAVKERQLRGWFEKELITAAGTRGFVHQGKETTGGLPNNVVSILQKHFLVRSEIRAGGTWIELVHDRLVDPIRESNSAWFEEHLSLLQRQAQIWEREGRPDGLLLRSKALVEAEQWAQAQENGLQPYEEALLASSLRTAKAEMERERKRNRTIGFLAALAVIVTGIALGAAYNQLIKTRSAEVTAVSAADDAQNQKSTAEAASTVAAGAAATAKSESGERAAAEHSAVIAEDEALIQRSTAEAAQTVASDALATSEANLMLDLTRQASTETVPIEPNPQPTPTPGSAENQTPTPNPTTIAQQDQLMQIQATQTKLADLPTQTPPELGDTLLRKADAMTMLFVPAGTFQMGSESRGNNEVPVHEVTLDTFWIDRQEVTNAQYTLCVNDGGCEQSAYVGDSDYNGDDYPVVGVAWSDAKTYCEWAEARLPTEAEWEYTARGPDAREFPWGDDEPACNLAQFSGCGGRTIPAGSRPGGASWAGALDMAGNVSEWVNDWYSDSYYADSPADSPPGPENGFLKIMRGGSWTSAAGNLRGSYRTNRRPDSWNFNIGFRCVTDQQSTK